MSGMDENCGDSERTIYLLIGCQINLDQLPICSVYVMLPMAQSCCCGHLSKKTAAFLLSGQTLWLWFDQKTKK